MSGGCGGSESCSEHQGRAPRLHRVVRPEPAVEKSFVENVTTLINEVTLQGTPNPSHFEDKEKIEWIKFEQFDLNDACLAADPELPLPLLLVLGYSKGVQGWLVPGSGEAEEVFSWRRYSVRCLKVLPTPLRDNQSQSGGDLFSSQRPLIAICDDENMTQVPDSFLTFESLKTGKKVKTLKFQHSIVSLDANRRCVVVVFQERIAVLCAASLEQRFTVSSCYLSPGPNVNPISLGERWLAYAERRHFQHYCSGGGANPDGAVSYKSTVVQYAKTFSKGVFDLKDTVASILSSSSSRSAPSVSCPDTSSQSAAASPFASSPSPTSISQATPGIITILDVEAVPNCAVSLLENTGVQGVVAHFLAHHNFPIVAMQFDPSGCVLLTADQSAHSFNVFRIHPHPLGPALSAVQHLYALRRGDTTAKVIDISFSFDTRWVAVSTHRGTTHVFPITPYGGDITVRTHTSPCVVNRQSQYERSARIDDVSTPPSGRNSPQTSLSYHHMENCPSIAYPNPRLPPYPQPTVVSPYTQLRQPLIQNIIDSIGASPTPSRHSHTSRSSPYLETPAIARVASAFASPRGWVVGTPPGVLSSQGIPSGFSDPQSSSASTSSLFVMTYYGNLIQYSVQPQPITSRPNEKLSSSSPIQLEMHAVAQWTLVRSTTCAERQTPLPTTNPLLRPADKLRAPPALYSAVHSAFSPGSSPEEQEHCWPGELDIITHSGPDRRNTLGPQFVLQPHGASEADLKLVRSSPVDIQSGCGRGTPIVVDASSYGSGSFSASPGLIERFSSTQLDNPGEITAIIKQGISEAVCDDPRLAQMTGELAEATKHDSQELFEDYEGPSGVFVGRCTPSITSRFSGSCRSLEDVERTLKGAVAGSGACGEGTRVRQMSATHYPLTLTTPLGSRASLGSSFLSAVSFEETKGMTSSAEELSTTLITGTLLRETISQSSAGRGAGVVESSKTWKPIEVPDYSWSYGPLERPEPTKVPRDRSMTGNFKSSEGKPSERSGGKCQVSEGCEDTGDPPVRPVMLPITCVSGEVSEPCYIPPGTTTGTSDEDLILIDVKKEKKKKKKRSKTASGTPAEELMISSSSNVDTSPQDSESFSTSLGRFDTLENKTLPCESDSEVIDSSVSDNKTACTAVLIDTSLVAEHFRTSPDDESEPATLPVSVILDENFDNQSSLDTFRQVSEAEAFEGSPNVKVSCDDDGNYATSTKARVFDNLDDFELQEDAENGNGGTVSQSKEALLSSMHSEEDLARALEEAYSDEDAAPRYTSTRASPPTLTARRDSRSKRVSELFPYVNSSDEEDSLPREQWPRLELRTSSPKPELDENRLEEMSTDDRGETSGDDKRGSDSSCNLALTGSAGKSKKKRKKRR